MGREEEDGRKSGLPDLFVTRLDLVTQRWGSREASVALS
jgi:hypothetical protein